MASRATAGLENTNIVATLMLGLLLAVLMYISEPYLARLFTWIKAKFTKPSQGQYSLLEVGSTLQGADASTSKVELSVPDATLNQEVDTEMLPGAVASTSEVELSVPDATLNQEVDSEMLPGADASKLQGADASTSEVELSLLDATLNQEVDTEMLPGADGSTLQEADMSTSEVEISATLNQEVNTEMLPGAVTIIPARLEEARGGYTNWGQHCNWRLNIGRDPADTPFVLMAEAYKMFTSASPARHRGAVQYEEEVVAMTASLFSPNELRREVCGSFTSGAFEATLLMVRASCSYLQEKKGRVIKMPEMIVPDDEMYKHVAAFLNVTMFRVPLDNEYKADVKAVRKLITHNTVLIVGSAPSFYNGIIDPIKELAELASDYEICFHVHLSVGGILLPFGAKLNYLSGAVDFSIEGVTSLAVDLDTDGLAPRGTNVLLYRNRKIRKHQFVVTEWSDGLYDSPTIVEGKNWGQVVGAWASMQCLGEEGYESYMRMVFDAANYIKEEINHIPEVYIIGKPMMAILAFGVSSTEVEIIQLCQRMNEKGWYLTLMKNPKSIRMHVTHAHSGVEDRFIEDLKHSILECKLSRETPWYNALQCIRLRRRRNNIPALGEELV